MEWAFHYSGPVEAKADPRCKTCASALQKECPTHGANFVTGGCAHCVAAQGGPCHAHWGLTSALEHYERELKDADQLSDFLAHKEILLTEPTLKTLATVSVSMRGCRLEGGLRETGLVFRPR